MALAKKALPSPRPL